MPDAARIVWLGAACPMTMKVALVHRHLISVHLHSLAVEAMAGQMQAAVVADRQSQAAKATLGFSDPMQAKQG